MRFALLGPVQVHGDEGPVEIRGALRRTLLAALLLHRGSVVSADRLGELVWGVNPPSSVTTSLYNQIMRLRQTLGAEAERIRAVAPGYVIEAGPDELDLDEFSRLCGEARQATAFGAWPEASTAYARALALWRGEMLADVPALHGHAAIHRFQEDRLVALQGRIEADLNLGRHEELVGELRTLIGYHPLREAFHGQLMLALYRSGRQAEALGVYRDLRAAIVSELGVEPGLMLQELHSRILKSDAELDAPRPGPEPAAEPARQARDVSRQLPVDTRLFTGREAEVAELVELAGSAGEGADAGMVVISAINGMGGIGKTALAVRVGHRVSEQFPDGQLFIDLRGYAADHPPVSAEEALDYLMRSLGVPPQSIPAELGERAARYRSTLAGTRTLIVLDNAASTAQVRPLLPGTPGCLVLVTSRNRLMGLDDAHFFPLDTLTPDEALALLRLISGPERVAANEAAAVELVALCGHVPLAVRILGARLRHHRSLTIPDLVAQLREESGRLEHLRDEDRDLASVFEASYNSLPESERRAFRLLGLLPGPDTDAYAAANLFGVDIQSAERDLEALVDHNLLIQHSPGRYLLHDLLRSYTRSLMTDPAEERECADRLLDYYEYTAAAVAEVLSRQHRPESAKRKKLPNATCELPDHASAVAWLRAERLNLLAALEQLDRPERLISFTSALATFLGYEVPKPRARALQQAATDAARSLGRLPEEAEALVNLAHLYRTDGDFDHVAQLLARALEIYRSVGDRLGEANVQVELGRVRFLTGEYAQATQAHERAVASYRELGDQLGEAAALYELARINTLVGDHELAERLAERALALFREHGKHLGEAGVGVVLANLRRRAGDYPAAAELLSRSITAFHEAGDRQSETNAMWTLGRIRLAQGDYEEAAALMEQTLVLCREIGTRQGIASGLGVLGTIRLAQGDLDSAQRLLTEAKAAFEEIGHPSGATTAQYHLGRVHHLRGQNATAVRLLTEAVSEFEQAGDSAALADACNAMGEVALETQGPKAGADWYSRALSLAKETASAAKEAEAHEGLARSLADSDHEAALGELREAIAIYRRLGAPELARAVEFLEVLQTPGDGT